MLSHMVTLRVTFCGTVSVFQSSCTILCSHQQCRRVATPEGGSVLLLLLLKFTILYSFLNIKVPQLSMTFIFVWLSLCFTCFLTFLFALISNSPPTLSSPCFSPVRSSHTRGRDLFLCTLVIFWSCAFAGWGRGGK